MRKYYTPSKSPEKSTILFGEHNDDGSVSTLVVHFYSWGAKLDADFDEWALLSRERTLLDLLAGAGLRHGKDLTVEQVCEILEVCGFEREEGQCHEKTCGYCDSPLKLCQCNSPDNSTASNRAVNNLF